MHRLFDLIKEKKSKNSKLEQVPFCLLDVSMYSFSIALDPSIFILVTDIRFLIIKLTSYVFLSFEQNMNMKMQNNLYFHLEIVFLPLNHNNVTWLRMMTGT